MSQSGRSGAVIDCMVFLQATARPNGPAAMSLPRDPDDEPYLNLAVAASADYLVTRGNDLLDLMQDSAFRARCPRLTILDPVALLQILSPPTFGP